MGKRAREKGEKLPDVRHGFDGNPPLLAVVKGVKDPETRVRSIAHRNVNHCTVCRLHHQHLLDSNMPDGIMIGDLRHKAAETLQDDFARAGLSAYPSTLAALASHGSGGGGAATEISDMKIDASRRMAIALRAVGYGGSFLLGKIVLEDWTLKQMAEVMHINASAVLPALCVSLDSLAAFYGLQIEARAKIRGGSAETIHPWQMFD